VGRPNWARTASIARLRSRRDRRPHSRRQLHSLTRRDITEHNDDLLASAVELLEEKAEA
jgi:hypothetical protein